MRHWILKENLAKGLVVLLLTALGCGDMPPPTPEEVSQPTEEAGREFDPATAGMIRGQVIWDGEIPAVPPLEVMPNPLAGEMLQKKQRRPNPNAPRIEPRTKGVANAVIFLRGLDPRRGKRWDHPPLRVEQRDGQFHLLQGDAEGQTGFVHRGDAIRMVSRDRFFHSLHASGAAFFTLTFPDPDRSLERPLKEKGIVELTSAAGYFWMRAYVFVDDHPYYARADSEGRFVLSQVPADRYEVVCWMPSWVKAHHERDPESGVVSRLFFQPAVCRVQSLTLEPTETKEITFVLSPELFIERSAR
jgi:hypothetical protein